MLHKLYINGKYFETVEIPGFPPMITRVYQITMPPETAKDGDLCIAELIKLRFVDELEYGYHTISSAKLERVVRETKKAWDEC